MHVSPSLEKLVYDLAKAVNVLNNALSVVTEDLLKGLKNLVPPDNSKSSKAIYDYIFSSIALGSIDRRKGKLRPLLKEYNITDEVVIKYVKDNIKEIPYSNTLYVGLKELFSEFKEEQEFGTFIDYFYSYTRFSYLLDRFPDNTKAFNFIFSKVDRDLFALSGKRLSEDMNVEDILKHLAKSYDKKLEVYKKMDCHDQAKLEELKEKCIKKITEEFSKSIPAFPSKNSELPSSHPPAMPILASDDQASEGRILSFGKEEHSSKGPSRINLSPPKKKFEAGLPDVLSAFDVSKLDASEEKTKKMEIINDEGKTGEEIDKKNKGEPDENIDGEKNKKKTKGQDESEKPCPGGPSSPNDWDNRKIAIIVSSVAGGLAVVGACVAAYYFSKRGKNQTPSLSA